MNLAALIRILGEKGLTPADIAEVVEVSAVADGGQPTARQLRNQRYYESKRLKSSESKTDKTVSDVSDAIKTASDAAAQAASRTRVVVPSLPSLRSEELTPIPPSGGIAPRHAKPNGFARFWQAYPNKTGKGAAEQAFAKALKHLSGHDPPGQLIAAIDRAKRGRQWVEGFVPNPTTWLNQRRWEDEIEPPREAHERSRADPKLQARQDNLARHERGADLAARLHRQS